jgi:hypothetical protein
VGGAQSGGEPLCSIAAEHALRFAVVERDAGRCPPDLVREISIVDFDSLHRSSQLADDDEREL